MTRALRTLVAALVVSASLALGGQVSTTVAAWAGAPTEKCPFISVADSSKAAMAVFVGTVDSVVKQDKPAEDPGAYYLQSVTVSRVYQGEVDSETVEVRSERTAKQCSLGELEVGTEYLFFVVASGDPWVAESGGGTVPTDPDVIDKIVRVLGEGRSPVAPPKPSAEFTPVNTEDPTALSRAAAPGLALVLIGLLGLVVVRGLGRRAERL